MTAIDVHPTIVEKHWLDEAATIAAAQQLARHPAVAQAIITLQGDLGAGKTTLVRHLLRALGVQGRVKSPTYAVVEPYELEHNGAPLAVWHFDFYRFADPREWEDAGFRDIFASPGLKLVEWPQRAHPMLPQADLAIHLSISGEHSRLARLQAHTATGHALLNTMDALDTQP